jgi:two-component system cell cycle response regulator DivK
MRILVVEDDEPSLDIARRVVEGMGHTVLTARDGVQGLALARSERPDLVLLDLHLPGLSGVEVVRELRVDEHLRALPVIAVSAGTLVDRENALSAGCNDFVFKPYEFTRLRAAIDRQHPA